MGLLLYSRFARGTPSVSLCSTDLRRSACLLPAQRAANSTPSKREPFWALYDSLFFSFTRVTFYLQSRPPSSREVARRRRDGRSRLASRRILLQSRFARQLPQRGSPLGRFMILCFFIRKNSVYLQSRPPSSRDIFHRRRQWRIQTMENAEGWHAKGVTEGVVPRNPLWGVLRFLSKQPDSLSNFFYQRLHRFINHFTYGFKMSINFGIGKADDGNSIFFKTGCSAFIICLSFVRKMLAAVQFNHQFSLCTIKIRNKSSDCFLSLKPNWILA